ncbi:neuropeptides capa receptor-like [Lytechinus variegatus]|uniref:neuropeptides capa receptor-like n=1 Tax=Lytechinus variegatus TaxID=7654 RepID=UPI001BB18BC5|nr:neuropeptides capa receptor-like [Lytechinus variegatus]
MESEYFDGYTIDYGYFENFSMDPKHMCYSQRRVNLSDITDFLYIGYERWVISLILPLILTTGLVSNLAFLYVVARVQSMRTVVNQYLVHLAIADMLFLVGAIGKKLWQYCESPIKDDEGSALGPIMVIISHLLVYTTIFASELLVTLVALERFYAVCRPMVVFAASSNNRKVSNLLCLVWLISVSLAASTIPSILRPVKICNIWPDEYSYLQDSYVKYSGINLSIQIYTYVIQTVPFFVVMVINSILYVWIMKEMERRLKAMERHDLDLQTNVEIRNQVSRMLIANGIIFFILMAPFQFGSLINVLHKLLDSNFAVNDHESFLYIARLMVYCNSAINPIIYNISNSRYRAAFEEAFCKKWCQKRRSRRRPPKQLGNHSSVYATSITKASNSDSSLAGNPPNNGNETCV